jgi:hypothetical protein
VLKGTQVQVLKGIQVSKEFKEKLEFKVSKEKLVFKELKEIQV